MCIRDRLSAMHTSLLSSERAGTKTIIRYMRKMCIRDRLWDLRIAVVSTYTLIKNGDFIDILALSERLLHHKHDLMQKAVG